MIAALSRVLLVDGRPAGGRAGPAVLPGQPTVLPGRPGGRSSAVSGGVGDRSAGGPGGSDRSLRSVGGRFGAGHSFSRTGGDAGRPAAAADERTRAELSGWYSAGPA